MRILVLGPLPPPLGGTTVLFEDFVRRFGGVCEKFEVVDTNDKVAGAFIARCTKMLTQWYLIFRALWGVDVVVLHASARRAVFSGAVLYLLTRMSGKRLVVRVFGGALDLFFDRAGLIGRFAFSALFRADLILLETRHLMRYFQENFPVSNIHWLPNCRDVNYFSEDRAKTEGGRNGAFVFVGRISRDKGVEAILEAVKVGGQDWLKVDFFGPLDDGYTPDYLNSQPGVRYGGVVPSDHVPELLGKYTALVLPTVYEGEGYPGVVLEAFSQGTPVVANSWRAIPEIVVDGESGLLVPVGDTLALVNALRRVLFDENLWAKLSMGAREGYQFFDADVWHKKAWIEWMSEVRGVRK